MFARGGGGNAFQRTALCVRHRPRWSVSLFFCLLRLAWNALQIDRSGFSRTAAPYETGSPLAPAGLRWKAQDRGSGGADGSIRAAIGLRLTLCPRNRPVGIYPNCCPSGTEFHFGACRSRRSGGTNGSIALVAKSPSAPAAGRLAASPIVVRSGRSSVMGCAGADPEGRTAPLQAATSPHHKTFAHAAARSAPTPTAARKARSSATACAGADPEGPMVPRREMRRSARPATTGFAARTNMVPTANLISSRDRRHARRIDQAARHLNCCPTGTRYRIGQCYPEKCSPGWTGVPPRCRPRKQSPTFHPATAADWVRLRKKHVRRGRSEPLRVPLPVGHNRSGV